MSALLVAEGLEAVALDRNKTEITHAVTDAACLWLTKKGFKPVEREVTVASGWCADIGAAIDPTDTELINLKLIPRKPPWKLYKTPAWDEWESLRTAQSRLLTCLVEVKTSRGDFRGDKKWAIDPPTDLAYLAMPKGLIAESEWPGNWGIFEFDPSRGTIRHRRCPVMRCASPVEQRDFLFELALKCDHRVRYAGFREREKERRVQERSVTIARHTRNVLAALKAVQTQRYGSLDEALLMYGLHKLPEPIKESLREFVNPGSEVGPR